MKRLLWIFLLTLALAALSTGAALAQEPQPTPSDDAVNAVAKKIFCPVCENTPLDVCPTEACKQWRALIRQQLAEGKTEEEIRDYLVSRYGASVLSEPPREGLNWLIYIVPPAIFAIGAGFLFKMFRTFKKPAPTTGQPDPSTPKSGHEDNYIQQIEDELRKRN